MHTTLSLAFFFTLFTCQLDASHGEQRALGGWILHLYKPCVEVNFWRQRRDRDERRGSDRKYRSNSFCSQEQVSLLFTWQNQLWTFIVTNRRKILRHLLKRQTQTVSTPQLPVSKQKLIHRVRIWHLQYAASSNTRISPPVPLVVPICHVHGKHQ